MATTSAAVVSIESFIDSWNGEFQDFPLTVEDLKRSHSLMGALFKIFDRIGISTDVVLKLPTERNFDGNMVYYGDLVPVINMTRVVNHLFSVVQQFSRITINHFLQPTAASSRSILLILFNLMVFNELRLQCIAPREDEIFNYNDMVKALEDKKNKMREMMNRQAEERGNSAQRMEQMSSEIQQLEEELRQEELARDQEKHEVDSITKENNMTDILLDQKRATKEGLLAETEKKKAMRVYDAEDIRVQAAQATQNVQEAEERLVSLNSIIAQKETSLSVLQMIKPKLDTAYNLLDEIIKLKDSEMGDLDDEDSRDGELNLLQTDLMELEVQKAELSAQKEEFNKKRAEAQATRQQEKALAERALSKAEEDDRIRRELAAGAARRTDQIKEQTLICSEQKARGFETIQQLKEDFYHSINAWEEALIKLFMDVKADLENEKFK